MADQSASSSPSLTLLLQEIEATPKGYWTELLGTLRQFRQKLPPATPKIINAEQARKNQAAIDLMHSWIENDDAAEHQKAWNFLETALDEYRLSYRSLFPQAD